MFLEIITPTCVVFADEVDRVKLPGSKGAFEILNNHAPIVATLLEGFIRVSIGKDIIRYFKVSGGVVECKSNKIIVLSERASEMASAE
jgi:F-type H+-transporting ATPase subunit epsilon